MVGGDADADAVLKMLMLMMKVLKLKMVRLKMLMGEDVKRGEERRDGECCVGAGDADVRSSSVTADGNSWEECSSEKHQPAALGNTSRGQPIAAARVAKLQMKQEPGREEEVVRGCRE